MEFGGYYQSLIVIFVILGFLGLFLWIVKKYGTRFGFNPMRQTRNLYLEDSIALGPKRDACVVRYNKKKFLLGVTDSRITLLSVINDTDNTDEQKTVQNNESLYKNRESVNQDLINQKKKKNQKE